MLRMALTRLPTMLRQTLMFMRTSAGTVFRVVNR
jgi:hypothetical protein